MTIGKEGSLKTVRVAEFFAGIGLVRMGLEQAGNYQTVFANDFDSTKYSMYGQMFGSEQYVLSDISQIEASDIPDIDLATASFPCKDLSLAGKRAGLSGNRSKAFWDFMRIIDKMADRRPNALLIENVVGFGSSKGGTDLAIAIGEMNRMGYTCDVFIGDAKYFVPQSRPRLFIIGIRNSNNGPPIVPNWAPTAVRPKWVASFVAQHSYLNIEPRHLELPPQPSGNLDEYVDRPGRSDGIWWGLARVAAFRTSLSELQLDRLMRMASAPELNWATAYRRTRRGRATWEIREDSISGCLRTSTGGSSRQAVVEAGFDEFRIRWMSPGEYAKLQAAPDYPFKHVSANKVIYALGDAVCVSVIGWIAREYLNHLFGLVNQQNTNKVSEGLVFA